MSRFQTFTFSATTPAAPGTAISASQAGLERYDWFQVDADLIGATGGTLDVYLQREIAPDVWRDWLHFPQLAAGVPAVKYSAQSGAAATISAVGTGDASTATPALAANTFIGGHPGNRVRAVYVAGASTSAGAAVIVRVTGWLSFK